MAIYGNVIIPKSYCDDCKGYYFVINGQLACCGKRPFSTPFFYKRESEPVQHRKTPGRKMKQLILNQQDNRCFYCEQTFGSTVERKGKQLTLRIHWDHQIPYAYAQNNTTENFVAACQVCNTIKSDICFQTIDEAKLYLEEKRKSKGYNF